MFVPVQGICTLRSSLPGGCGYLCFADSRSRADVRVHVLFRPGQ